MYELTVKFEVLADNQPVVVTILKVIDIDFWIRWSLDMDYINMIVNNSVLLDLLRLYKLFK